jgi:hypothetical protein
MKKLSLILLLSAFQLFSFSAFGIETVTAYLTITTNPHVGSVIGITGVETTWTNNTGASSYWVQTTNNTRNATTNLYYKLSLLGFTNVNSIDYTNATNLVFYGMQDTPLTITLSGPGGTNWGTVTYVTNFTATGFTLNLPLTNNNEQVVWTNIVDEMAHLLNFGAPTIKVSAAAPLFDNFVGLDTATQTSSNKTFVNGTNKAARVEITGGGYLNGAAGTNWSYLSVTNLRARGGYASDLTYSGMQTTNAVAWDNLYIGDSVSGNYTQWAIRSGTNSLGQEVFILYNDTSLANAMVTTYDGSGFSFSFGQAATDMVIVSGGLRAQTATNGTAHITNIVVHTGAITGATVTATSVADLTGAIIRSSTAITGALAAITTANLGDTILSNVVRSSQSGPWSFSVGTYSTLTGGGSNNIVQLATNAWTLLSGNVSACNLNSLRFADGLPAGGRRAGIINASLFDQTLIDSANDGFETLATNRMLLGNSANLVIPPGGAAEFIYDTAASRWRAISPTAVPSTATNLTLYTNGVAVGNGVFNVVLGHGALLLATNLTGTNHLYLGRRTEDFAGSSTTNQLDFNSAQVRRMTNAMTTNHVWQLTNIVAGLDQEIYLTGANGGVIASNYTFRLNTNGLTTATKITWLTTTNGTYDLAVSSNKWGRLTLTAPFTTNIFAKYEEGP